MVVGGGLGDVRGQGVAGMRRGICWRGILKETEDVYVYRWYGLCIYIIIDIYRWHIGYTHMCLSLNLLFTYQTYRCWVHKLCHVTLIGSTQFGADERFCLFTIVYRSKNSHSAFHIVCRQIFESRREREWCQNTQKQSYFKAKPYTIQVQYKGTSLISIGWNAPNEFIFPWACL